MFQNKSKLKNKMRISLVTVLLLLTFHPYQIPDTQTYRYDSDPIVVTGKATVPTHMIFDYQLLARLVNAEAGYENFQGKHAVADVVVHISKSKNWSISEVVYDRGRFDGIRSKLFFVEPSIDCYDAARKSLNGIHILPNSVHFFHNPLTSTDSEWISYISKYTYKQIGNHLFCHNPHLL